MKLKQCEAGHFYDGDKYPDCPYCNSDLLAAGDSGIVTAAEKPAAAPVGTPGGPVAGWLVVLDGPARGRDLRLGQGRTVLGVDEAGWPATLSHDAALSVRQAEVIYDPQEGSFTLAPGTAQELAYLNGRAVVAPQPLAAGAELRLGGARLRFVPFCGEFRW
ncbi:MAG: FHA domain-containing protein [Gemmiger sp.]